jgi:hypothetical protein
MNSSNHLAQLGRLRWAVRGVLALGIAASIAANVLHANPNPISQAISAWPPLALLLTVELTSRIPMHKRGLAALRVLSTVAIAGIAAWVSYWHMQGVSARYGEVGVSAYLLPVTVDGLIVVASVSLVELAGRIRTMEAATEAAPAKVATVQPVQPPAIAAPQSVATVAAPAAQQPAAAPVRRGRTNGRVSAANRSTTVTSRVRKTADERREEIANVRSGQPDITQVEIARALGISERHLRRLDDAPAT